MSILRVDGYSWCPVIMLSINAQNTPSCNFVIVCRLCKSVKKVKNTKNVSSSVILI